MAKDNIQKNGLLLGAHVSTAGGLANAPPRGKEISATAMQIFTKIPSRWAERPIGDGEADAFREGREVAGIAFACAHDSYLINLASPDTVLAEKSWRCFRGELERSRELGLDAIVTHPGNAMDQDVERAIDQNAALIERALDQVPDGPMVLLETTAGCGTALGATFEELAAIRERIRPTLRHRVGVCFDTCHAFAAGYDLSHEYDAVMHRFDQTVGIEHLRLFHLNDSQKPLGSRRDRHAEIGEGELGAEAFRHIMNDPRFHSVPKVLETPKGDDFVVADRRNLDRLRSLIVHTDPS